VPADGETSGQYRDGRAGCRAGAHRLNFGQRMGGEGSLALASTRFDDRGGGLTRSCAAAASRLAALHKPAPAPAPTLLHFSFVFV
jgi:hypothetical protein